MANHVAPCIIYAKEMLYDIIIISWYNCACMDNYNCAYYIFLMQSMNAKGSKNYPNAKQYGRNALILTIINIMFTLLIAALVTGLAVGFECADPPFYSYSYSKFINVMPHSW